MQNVLALETRKYSIKINNFEGPLDLLCHLIDKNKMDICEINLSEITDQYMDLLNEMERMNLEIASEFLVMASTLLYIKSKNLLPSEAEDESELTEEELLRRIIEYKRYKEITKTFREQMGIYAGRCFKRPDQVELPKQKLEKNQEKLTTDLQNQTKTSTVFKPCSIAVFAAVSATSPAANGVLFLEPLNPNPPALAQDITLPLTSVIVTIVLLKLE